MQNIAIIELKANPSLFTRYLEEGESVFVTELGKPIAVTVPVGDDLFFGGVKKIIALELYKKELISLGKMAELLGVSKIEAIKLLGDLDIDWTGLTTDELDKQIEVLEKL